ncbi:transmembrane protein, putative (macronuclear) [Tetrahymena thermophila SB210]|uniref:Transmembrane protein, putative n=1 Tax=Tetrahymena thermophila (strain SB210) TaxID=312017 RepID=W7XKR4_TETTS|nr:transmembrane protein, putative [Tetrahymena thermophila SB210]EWS76751.1 transmembrane protein, putative [Tetrahymena thermophila SB210]|eukprot:XP_012650713.1 transmembrane protein, putative [Tetrahymena thermophila SB210]
MNQKSNSLFEAFDIFGAHIHIKYNKKTAFNTRFGGIITFCLSGILIMYIVNIINVYISHSQVQVIQEIQNLPNSNQFNLTVNNFSFMVGITDVNFTQFIDESVYTLTIKQFTQQRILNQNTGTYDKTQEYRLIKLQRCTTEHFKIQQTNDFFLQQDYNNFYCLSLDEQLQLQGIFNSQIFQQIEIEVSSCQGNNCADPQYISSKLNNCYLQIYFVDKNVVTTDLKNPFHPIGRSVFYIAGKDFSKTINLYFAQNQMSSDKGIVFEDIKTKVELTYSIDREQVVQKYGNRLFLLQISLDPNREILYSRKYLTFSQVLSQIGGIYNILFALGCFICRPYSQLQYKRSLINQLFGFQYSLPEEQSDQIGNNKEKILKEQNLDQNTDLNNYNVGGNQTQLQQKRINLDIDSQNCSNNQILYSKNTQSQKNQNLNVILKQQKESTNKDEKNLKKFFEQTFEEMKTKSFDYLKYYLGFIICKKAKSSYAIEYGMQKLYKHIDIVQIINKLIEFEKLKRLLLNENQLKLFDYIPKPIIKVNKLTGQIITQNNSKDSIDIFFEVNRSQIQKAEDAQEAYNNIFNSDQKKQQLDEKLISLLHPKLIELFKQQQFDKQKKIENRKYLMKQRNSKLNIQSPIKQASYFLERNIYQQYLMQDSQNYLTEQQIQIQSPLQLSKSNNQVFVLKSSSEIKSQISVQEEMQEEYQSQNENQDVFTKYSKYLKQKL